MKKTLVISSFVAGSNVGGSLAMKVLPILGQEVSLLPTTLLGRHPGWGAPGGGAVSDDLFAGMIEGLVANGIPQSADVILTGYFASAEQVSRTAEMIRQHASASARIIVDTIMGDFGKGLYVKEDVAEAIVRDLIPRAHLVKGNAWEFWEIERRLARVNAMPEAPRSLDGLQAYCADLPMCQRMQMITSVTDSDRIGLFAVDSGQTAYAGEPAVSGGILPNGLGDFVSLMLAHKDRTAELKTFLDNVLTPLSALIDMQDASSLHELDLSGLMNFRS